MCLTLPAKVLKIKNNRALVAFSNQEREVKIVFSEGVAIDDWLLVNADLAIAKISQQEAQELNNYFNK